MVITVMSTKLMRCCDDFKLEFDAVTLAAAMEQFSTRYESIDSDDVMTLVLGRAPLMMGVKPRT